MHTFSLNQLLAEPTHVTHRSSSPIDIIAVDQRLLVNESGTIEMYDLTDNRLVYADISMQIPKARPREILYRDFKLSIFIVFLMLCCKSTGMVWVMYRMLVEGLT